MHGVIEARSGLALSYGSVNNRVASVKDPHHCEDDAG